MEQEITRLISVFLLGFWLTRIWAYMEYENKWVELECDKVKLDCNDVELCYPLETYNHCQELKEKL